LIGDPANVHTEVIDRLAVEEREQSNSRLRVLAFALRTQSTPTLHRMITSHASFADGLLAIEPIISGGTALAMTSSAVRSSV
jgi:hypothetical protein